MSGLGDKIKGSAKEAAGKVTDDKELQAKGKADKAIGNIKEHAEDAKDKVSDRFDDDKRKNDD